MEQFVISEALDTAIKNYIKYKSNPESPEFNDFYVIIIRLLCIIYSEPDIINPYLSKDGRLFDVNLTKYGYELDKIIDLKEQIQKAYVLTKTQKINPYFINIQKILIDMIMVKKDHDNLDDSIINSFYELLYTPVNKNPLQLSYNFLNAKDELEVDEYFKQELIKHQKVNNSKPKIILNPEVYPIVGISMEQVNGMNADSLDLINNQIYAHFGIKENAVNKEYLLEKEIEKYKKSQAQANIGSGYVNILLVLGIIATIVMYITIGTLMLD